MVCSAMEVNRGIEGLYDFKCLLVIHTFSCVQLLTTRCHFYSSLTNLMLI